MSQGGGDEKAAEEEDNGYTMYILFETFSA